MCSKTIVELRIHKQTNHERPQYSRETYGTTCATSCGFIVIGENGFIRIQGKTKTHGGHFLGYSIYVAVLVRGLAFGPLNFEFHLNVKVEQSFA